MSMKQRLQNDSLARILHAPLYERIKLFAEQYTPELPADVIASGFMNRLFNGDDNLHIMIEYSDNWDIIGHAIAEVQEYGGHKIIMVHQASADKNKQSSLNEGVEYIDKLAEYVGAYCTIFMVTKHIPALQKKYGYKVSRQIMMKQYSTVSGDSYVD